MLLLSSKVWTSNYLLYFCKRKIAQKLCTKRSNFALVVKFPVEARHVFFPPPPTRRRPSVDIAPIQHPCKLSCFCGLLKSFLGEYPRRSFTCDSNKMALNKLSIDKVDLKDKRILMRYFLAFIVLYLFYTPNK